MKEHNIALSTILVNGKVETGIRNGALVVTTKQRLTTEFDRETLNINNYIYLQDNYRLPMRIDLTVKIDSPALYLFLGNGHINFGTPWSDNRRIDDIIEPNHKVRFFHNSIPTNEFADISVIYAFKAMQILVNGEERFFSQKEKYMKSKMLQEFNESGLMIKIASSKLTQLVISNLKISEYDKEPLIIRNAEELPKPLTSNEAINTGEKPQFDKCIALLPKELHDEVIKTDEFLMALKPIKLKRQIEKHGNKITYLASDYGFSYAIRPSNDILTHSLGWYILTSSKPELWHRKADMMEEVLKKLAETSEEFAEKMFRNLSECIACRENCAVRTIYEFKGEKKVTCHGLMEFKMTISDFEDVRKLINEVNRFMDKEML